MQAKSLGSGVKLFEWDGSVSKPVDTSRPIDDPILRTTFENGVTVSNWLRDRFGQESWDGAGTPLKMHVRRPGAGTDAPVNNAWFDTRAGALYFGDGDGRTFAPLGMALDVVAHEAMHGVLASKGFLSFGGEGGALHESFSDVLAASLDDDNWLIGEDVFTPGRDGDAIRDLKNPRYAHMNDVPTAFTAVHELSGVPTTAAVHVAEQVGRDAMADIWFSAATKHIRPGDGFVAAAEATRKAAEELYGTDSAAVKAVIEGWKQVGVLSDGERSDQNGSVR